VIPLSVVLFDRGANGVPTTNNPVNLAGRVESYEDALSDRYGFETARVSWAPTAGEIEEWARYDHLMRPMVAYSPDARQIWRGVLAEIEISIGTKKIAFSLKDMANRLTVRYSEPGGAQGDSSTYSSAASQALFGIKDRVINASVALSAAASNQAQTILNYIAYPRSKQSSAAGTARGDLGITLTFWGKYALLDWLLTSSTSTTSTATSTQIASLLASYAAINAFFSSSAASIAATGVSDTEYIEPDTTYREKIERLCARGNSAQQPLAWGFYDDDAFVVAARASANPSTITYYESEASGQIRDQWQNVVEPWDVRPNAMALVTDLIDAPTPGSIETPLRKYVARVTRSVRGEDVTVTLEPDDTESLEDLLTSPAGAGPAGTSERQAAFERKVTAPARSVFAGMDNATRYDRSQGVWKPAAGGTGKVNTGTIDTGGGDIVNTGGGNIDLGTGSGIGGSSGSLSETIDDRVAALLQAGNLISLTYNDAGNTLTIAVSSLNETIDDRVAALLQAGVGISLTYNDAGNTLTIDADASAPPDARYWVATANATLTNETNLGALSSGLLKQSVASGVATPAIAVAGTDYAAASHTHTSGQITDFGEAVDDEVAGLLTAGNLISLSYNDTAGTLTIAVASLNETIDDRVAALLVAGSGITLTYNDAGNSLTIAASGGISGSGTVEQLSYWTGASALGGAPIYYDVSNNRIGVKDSTPCYDLDVNATIRATSGISAGSPATIAAGGQMRAQGRIQTDEFFESAAGYQWDLGTYTAGGTITPAQGRVSISINGTTYYLLARTS